MSYDVLLNGKQEKQHLFVKWFRVKTGISCFLLDVCFHKSLLFINATKATGVKCTWFLALTIMFGRVLYLVTARLCPSSYLFGDHVSLCK